MIPALSLRGCPGERSQRLANLDSVPLRLRPGTAGHEKLARVVRSVAPCYGGHGHQRSVLYILQLVTVVIGVRRRWKMRKSMLTYAELDSTQS